MLVFGSKDWITKLHYAFQDKNNLVRTMNFCQNLLYTVYCTVHSYLCLHVSITAHSCMLFACTCTVPDCTLHSMYNVHMLF